MSLIYSKILSFKKAISPLTRLSALLVLFSYTLSTNISSQPLYLLLDGLIQLDTGLLIVFIIWAATELNQQISKRVITYSTICVGILYLREYELINFVYPSFHDFAIVLCGTVTATTPFIAAYALMERMLKPIEKNDPLLLAITAVFLFILCKLMFDRAEYEYMAVYWGVGVPFMIYLSAKKIGLFNLIPFRLQ